MEKMTAREFYEAVMQADVKDELKEFARIALEKLDHTNSLRREKALAKAEEKEAAMAPVREKLMAVMTDEFKTATMLIADAGVEITPHKVPHLLKGLVEDGTVVKGEVKVTGKGKQVGYAKA